MKRIIPIISCALCCCLMSLPVSAATYVDDMAEPASNNFKNYYHLARFQHTGLLDGMADKTALTFASVSSPSGWVDYRVKNARQITLTLYSQAGTFVGQPVAGAYVLGLADENTGSLAGKTLYRASYSPSSRGVYTRLGGGLFQAYYDGKQYVFAPTNDSPADLMDYGVNVYVSASGSSYTRLTLANTQVSYTPGNAFCSETLSASIPYDAAYIRVELNDSGRFPLLDKPGQYIDKAYILYNALASVTLTGDSMVFGVPEPVVAETAPATLPSAVESPASSSRQSSSSKASAATQTSTASASAKSSAASTPSSKFTGVIESSVSSRNAASSKAAPSSSVKSSAASQEPPQEQTATAPATYEQPAEVIFQAGGGEGAAENDHVSTWVLAYIFAVIGAMLAILLKGGGKKG